MAMTGPNKPEPKRIGVSVTVDEDQAALELATIVTFMREDPDNVVFRRFERLNLYNLLSLQHRLVAYDEQISRYEKEWNGPALAELLPKLEALMKSYSELYKPSQVHALTRFR
jgi:hypothetical protein